MFRAVTAPVSEFEGTVVGIEFVIQDVVYLPAVDAQQDVPFPETPARGGGPGLYISDLSAQFLRPPSSAATNKGGGTLPLPFGSSLLLLFPLEDFTAVVRAALLANSVRQVHLSALGTGNESGRFQRPVGTAPFVSSRAGNLILWYRHS